jgi:hypothetical protein
MSVDVGTLMAYEAGELGALATLEFFGGLVKSGMAWSLQGHYGRTAAHLIENDWLTAEGELTEKAYNELVEEN